MSELVGHADPVASLDGASLNRSIVTDPAPDEPATVACVRVRLAGGPLAAPVLSRVVSMMLARADWPLDRLDDALLVCEALSAHAFAHASDTAVTFDIEADTHEARLRVIDLADGGATGLIQDAMLPVVGNVLERIAERVSAEPGVHGEGSQLDLVLRARSSQRP
jgi:hypothetical protein